MFSSLSFADLISIINAIFGLLAIIILFENFGLDLNIQIRVSFSLILLAMLADGLDGIFARKFGKSEIGEIFDSMADMTSFVIAPSIFIYFVYSNKTDFLLFYRHIYLIAALILFLSFGIIRLASFHLMKKNEFFIGIPTPASTIILLNLAYLELEFIYILPAVVIIGAAMVSNIKFPKPRIRMDIIALILILLTLIFGKSYYAIFPLLLLSAMIIYVIIGPIFYKKFVE
jgi:CDP-diacylglycerol--serine O-phosphatidyltransferase